MIGGGLNGEIVQLNTGVQIMTSDLLFHVIIQEPVGVENGSGIHSFVWDRKNDEDMHIIYMGNSFRGYMNMFSIIKLPLFSERQLLFIKAKIRRYFG